MSDTTEPTAAPKTAAELEALFHAWVMAKGRMEEAERKRKAYEELEDLARKDLNDAADALGGPLLESVERGPFRADKGGHPSRSRFVVFGSTLLRVSDYHREDTVGWSHEITVVPCEFV